MKAIRALKAIKVLKALSDYEITHRQYSGKGTLQDINLYNTGENLNFSRGTWKVAHISDERFKSYIGHECEYGQADYYHAGAGNPPIDNTLRIDFVQSSGYIFYPSTAHVVLSTKEGSCVDVWL
jgi:hypothetical protein